MVSNAARSDGPESVSAFVYGDDVTAVSAFVVGLAERRPGTFAWADCALGTAEPSPGPFRRGRARAGEEPIVEGDLVLPSWDQVAFERLLIPENRLDTLRLMSYLALPRLVQELASLSTSPTGESIVLLVNVDSLDRNLRESVLGNPRVYRRLEEALVSLFVTSRQPPTRKESSLFQQVYRVWVPEGDSWTKGTISPEKDHGSREKPRSYQIKEIWDVLGLDPTLLPPS
jgi:hypothetical protein